MGNATERSRKKKTQKVTIGFRNMDILGDSGKSNFRGVTELKAKPKRIEEKTGRRE